MNGFEALSETGRRLRRLLDRRQEDAEMDEELRFHLEMEAENNVRAGMGDTEARRRAALAFGGAEGHRERIREARGFPLLEDIWRDLRYAAGGLTRDRLFTVTCVAMLALGIGVNSALVGFVDFVAISPVRGVADPERMAVIGFGDDRFGTPHIQASEALRYIDAQASFAAVGGVESVEFLMDVDGLPVPVRGLVSLGDYFSAMRFDMAVGRALSDAPGEDDQAVVLSHRAWWSRFNGTPEVIGQTVRINGRPMTVVGVVSKEYAETSEFWLTTGAARLLGAAPDDDFSPVFGLRGRLKPGVSREQAEAEGTPIISAVASPRGNRSAAEIVTRPLRLATIEEIGPIAGLISVLTMLILAIACSNVAVLLISRGVVRRREISIRLSVGASRTRVLRQLLTEGLLLAILAGFLGIGILWAINGMFELRIGGELDLDFQPNVRTTAITFGIACVSALVFSLAPAPNATRGSLRNGLADAAGGADPRSVRLQRVLVAGEFALSVALGCATGLVVESVRREATADQGFEVSDRVGMIGLGTRLTSYTESETLALLEGLANNLALIPGTVSTSFGGSMPGSGSSGIRFLRESRVQSDPLAGSDTLRASADLVGPDYLRTLGIPILAGRDLDGADVTGTPRVMILSDRLAADLWPAQQAVGQSPQYEQLAMAGQRAIGQTVRYERVTSGGWIVEEAMVVGVAGTVDSGLSDAYSEIMGGRTAYFPAHQLAMSDTGRAGLGSTIFVRRSTPIDQDWASGVRRQLATLAPDIPVDRIQTTRQRQLERNGELIGFGIGAGAGGLIALTMAAVGVFATTTFRIEQRRRELAIRQAIGATEGRIVLEMFKEGMSLAMIGFIIGLPLGLLVLRLASSELGGFGRSDVASIGGISLILLLIAALASWLPARRAASIQPMEALRS